MDRGRRIVTSSDDGTVRIYDRRGVHREDAVLLVTAPWNVLSTEEERRSGRTSAFLDSGTRESVWAAMPSPDGRWILTGTQTGDLKRWDVRECLRAFVCEAWQGVPFGPQPLDPQFAFVNAIDYDPRGRLLAVARDWEGTLILGRNGARRASLLEYTTQSLNTAFNRDGDRLVTTSSDGKARVWDISDCARARSCTPRRMRTLQHPCVVYAAAFSPDGTRLVTGCGDRSARIWNWQDRDSSELVLRGHRGNIRAVAFSPNGERVVTVGVDRTTRIWDAESGQILGVLQMHTDRVQSVAVDPNDPAVILTASDDGTTRLYRCRTCGSLGELEDIADDLRDAVDAPPRLLGGS
jgi:WD40 repeat protein